MQDKKISTVLKEFGLSDDDILLIAVAPTLKNSVSILKEKLVKRWNIDTITAMKTVENLKKEFE